MSLSPIKERIRQLEEHLRNENPVLADSVPSFVKLDEVARELGLLSEQDSHAAKVPWLPVIAVLGTFSAGKSTFLNHYVGRDLQRTGNQAVDDKFTVICFGPSEEPTTLPGMALDNDPRFPFYRISDSIEEVSAGDGRKVDSFLQLKTVRSEALRGKIFIDSPGFDADRQRTSTLVITEHIIDLSDLVLVFFDARHPEPGAMTDTLKHLVADTVNRPDATKFLYILNQIDNTAREDNPEEVVAAWQRALAQSGLTAGRFYRSFARGVEIQCDDPQVRERLLRKRDEDMADIETRIRQVEVERAYRVIGMLEKTALRIRDELVPRITVARRRWYRLTAWLFGILVAAIAGGALYWSLSSGQWDGWQLRPVADFDRNDWIVTGVVVLVIGGLLHHWLRSLAGRWVLRTLRRGGGENAPLVARGFAWNLEQKWPTLRPLEARGWNGRNRRRLDQVLLEGSRLVEKLNDQYASPAGRDVEDSGEKPAA